MQQDCKQQLAQLTPEQRERWEADVAKVLKAKRKPYTPPPPPTSFSARRRKNYKVVIPTGSDRTLTTDHGPVLSYHWNVDQGLLSFQFSPDEVGMDTVDATEGISVDVSGRDLCTVLVEVQHSDEPLACRCGDSSAVAVEGSGSSGLPPFELSTSYSRAADTVSVFLTAEAAVGGGSTLGSPQPTECAHLYLRMGARGLLAALVIHPASVAVPDYCGGHHTRQGFGSAVPKTPAGGTCALWRTARTPLMPGAAPWPTPGSTGYGSGCSLGFGDIPFGSGGVPPSFGGAPSPKAMHSRLQAPQLVPAWTTSSSLTLSVVDDSGGSDTGRDQTKKYQLCVRRHTCTPTDKYKAWQPVSSNRASSDPLTFVCEGLEPANLYVFRARAGVPLRRGGVQWWGFSAEACYFTAAADRRVSASSDGSSGADTGGGRDTGRRVGSNKGRREARRVSSE